MSNYDPFSRGPHPAGVRDRTWTDETRDRALPISIWYPADDAHRGQDLDDATRDEFHPFVLAPKVKQDAVRDAAPREGPFPLVVFSHGFGGVKTQSTHFCTHLASHGYVVVAMDHVGNTTFDVMQMMTNPPKPESFGEIMHDRPRDASFVIDRVLAGEAGIETRPEQAGISGHSFGGWTTLVTTGRDPRIRAALPLAPAGGETPLSPGGTPNLLGDALDLAWDRPVPTLFLLADLDTLLPLAGMHGLVERTPEPKTAVVLRDSDHFHFCDDVAQTHDLFKKMGPMLLGAAAGNDELDRAVRAMKTSAELCEAAAAYAMTCGLGLAHFDAHLRGNQEAASLLTRDLCDVMQERGVAISLL